MAIFFKRIRNQVREYPSIIFISFDIRKDDYPAMNYSIASLIASLKNKKIKVGHYSFDLQHALQEKEYNQSITKPVTDKILNNLDYFKSFDYIALGLTSWTIEYCDFLLKNLLDYQGKVILGGYEVTAIPNDVLIKYLPRADYFIKGYAEKALKKIILSKKKPQSKVLNYPVTMFDLSSPYLKGVINIYSKKIHWETKRGCPYKCGFCEWGNAARMSVKSGKSSKNKIVHISLFRLNREMKLFRKSAVAEINILDGTFNFGPFYLAILYRLLKITNARINCQARFELLVSNSGKKFINICHEHRERIHLEFGLQSIYENECKEIDRPYNKKKTLEALLLLKRFKISYETSIIYAIPGQTVTTLIDTIEFLINCGCKKIRSYPQNS
jgi:radical SAM superfamily enzyme YgiQ (UPF0313 family)